MAPVTAISSLYESLRRALVLAEDRIGCVLDLIQNAFSARRRSSFLWFCWRWNFLRSLGIFHVRIWHELPGRLLTRHSAANNETNYYLQCVTFGIVWLDSRAPLFATRDALARRDIDARHPPRLASLRHSDRDSPTIALSMWAAWQAARICRS